MNPAISICFAIYRGFPWKQCGIYICFQFLGAMAAAAIAFMLFKDAILYVDPTMTETYTSFFSEPQVWVTVPTAVMNQFVAGCVMMIAILALGDDQNNPPGAGMHSFILGLLVASMKFSLGYNTGSSLNPASDFGPRVVARISGYSTQDCFGNPWWLYGPWIAALTGAITGCAIYDLFVFVGSESPVNYRIPEKYRKKVRKLIPGRNKH